MQRYPAYKDSGLDWLGDVPTHWETTKAKWLFANISEKNCPDEELLSATQEFGVVPRDMLEERVVMPMGELVHFKLVQQGDFVISLRSFQGGIEYSDYRGLVSPAYTVLRNKKPIDKTYFKHLMKCFPFISELQTSVTGIREGKNINYKDFAEIVIPIPPIREQTKIAEYIEAQTAVIHQFLTNKRRLIALLEEQKQVVINTAVTQGLETAVARKPSGIDWLGDIPTHWESKPIKRVAAILRGKFSHRPRNDPRMYDGKYPFIQTGNIESNKKYITEYHQTLSEDGYTISKEFPKGTLVMTITGSNTGNVAILNFVACFPDSIVGFVPTKDVDLDFLYYLFIAMKEELILTAPVNTQPNLNIEKIGALHAPFPSKEEQSKIVRYIEQKIIEINAAIERTQREIELIEEYRTTLIAHAVTGKIDVRSVV